MPVQQQRIGAAAFDDGDPIAYAAAHGIGPEGADEFWQMVLRAERNAAAFNHEADHNQQARNRARREGYRNDHNENNHNNNNRQNRQQPVLIPPDQETTRQSARMQEPSRVYSNGATTSRTRKRTKAERKRIAAEQQRSAEQRVADSVRHHENIRLQRAGDGLQDDDITAQEHKDVYYGYVFILCGFLSVIEGITACLMNPRALSCHPKSALKFSLIWDSGASVSLSYDKEDFVGELKKPPTLMRD
jgi:hypothetical protein